MKYDFKKTNIRYETKNVISYYNGTVIINFINKSKNDILQKLWRNILYHNIWYKFGFTNSGHDSRHFIIIINLKNLLKNKPNKNYIKNIFYKIRTNSK